MKYPKFITNNTTINLVTSSFSCATLPYSKRLENAIKYLKTKGYIINYNDNVFEDFRLEKDYFKNNAEIINQLFNEDDNALISVGGGYFMCNLLEFFDFEQMKKNPKWFMGYSDNTHLTFLLPTLCDVASIYGPHAGDFGYSTLHKSITDSLLLLKGEKLITTNYKSFELNSDKTSDPLKPWNLNKRTKIINYPTIDLTFEGRLIGGCLDILRMLIGTKFDNVTNFINKYKDDKIVWFFEACDMSLFDIYTTLIQFKNANWFNHTSGIIFGRPYASYDKKEMGFNRHSCVLKALEDLNIPIIFDANIGHVKPNTPLICGSNCKVSSKNNDLIISMELK